MKRIAYTLPLATVAALVYAGPILAQTQAPVLQVVTPAEGQTIYGNRVPILFAVQNFNVVEKPTAKASEGHILLWLDDKTGSMDTATKVTTDSFTYSDVSYGNHNLKAELVTDNDKPLSPPQQVTVNFSNAPISSPTPAAAEGFDKNTTFVILVIVALVIVAAWWYTREEDVAPDENPEKSKTTKKASKPKARKATKSKRK